jgi:hypothetical protein
MKGVDSPFFVASQQRPDLAVASPHPEKTPFFRDLDASLHGRQLIS